MNHEELLDRLTKAKKGKDPVELEAAKQALMAFRSKERASREGAIPTVETKVKKR